MALRDLWSHVYLLKSYGTGPIGPFLQECNDHSIPIVMTYRNVMPFLACSRNMLPGHLVTIHSTLNNLY